MRTRSIAEYITRSVIAMDLAHILHKMQIRESMTPSDPCSVSAVLSRICERFEVKEERVFVLEDTAGLFAVAPLDWLFPQAADLPGAYRALLTSFTGYSSLPVCDTDSGTLPAESYEDIPIKAQTVSTALLALCVRMQTAVKNDSNTHVKSLAHALAPIMCVFSITHLQEQPWTSDASRNCASHLLTSVAGMTDCTSVLELLCGDEDKKGVFGLILDSLQTELTKECWKRNQALKHVFSWMLVQIGRPWLAQYLEKVFPPALLISDDYRTENKVLGVHCLHHIVLNVPAADLRQYNRAQVLYHALFNHLYISDASLMQVVLPCLLDLMGVIEKPQAHARLPRKPNRFDGALRLILTHMEMEHKLDLRRVYASNLVLFIERMGVVIIRHLKRLERVIVGYLEVSDAPEEKTRLSILDALQKTLEIAWPRMEKRMGSLTQILLRFLVDVSSASLTPQLKEQLMSKASHCLLLLNHCSKGKLQALLQEVDSSCVPDPVLMYIQQITTARL